jgi:peptidyl-tRNA hydrolase
MTIAEALSLLVQLTTTLAQTTQNIQTVGAMIQSAQAAGRTTFTPEEWAQIQSIDSNARQALIDQITKALQK